MTYLTVFICYSIYCFFVVSYKKTTLMRKEKKYLIRYTLLSCKFFSVKVHKILLSDPDIHHDHPWNYLSIMLKGGYVEESLKKVYILDGYVPISRWIGPGSIIYRKANVPHRLIIPGGSYALTLVITFKKNKLWGFVSKDGHKSVYAEQ